MRTPDHECAMACTCAATASDAATTTRGHLHTCKLAPEPARCACDKLPPAGCRRRQHLRGSSKLCSCSLRRSTQQASQQACQCQRPCPPRVSLCDVVFGAPLTRVMSGAHSTSKKENKQVVIATRYLGVPASIGGGPHGRTIGGGASGPAVHARFSSQRPAARCTRLHLRTHADALTSVSMAARMHGADGAPKLSRHIFRRRRRQGLAVRSEFAPATNLLVQSIDTRLLCGARPRLAAA